MMIVQQEVLMRSGFWLPCFLSLKLNNGDLVMNPCFGFGFWLILIWQLVVIAGIVWNRPTSCAYAFLLPFLKEMARLLRLTWFCFSESRWAAKVLVNSDEACDHGRKVWHLKDCC